MNGGCLRRIPAAPAQQLGPPCQVNIFFMGEEILVEVLSLDPAIIEHFPPVQCGGTIDSKHLASLIILTKVFFAVAAQILATLAVDEQPGRVDDAGFMWINRLP